MDTWVKVNRPLTSDGSGVDADPEDGQNGELVPELPVVHDEYDWEAIAAAMQGQNGVEIKDRRFRLKLFRRVFLGSDAVNWLMIHEQATRSEALTIGQLMVKQRMIHHVLDEHDFKDEALFYRFYADEIEMLSQGMADEGGIEKDKKDCLDHSLDHTSDHNEESGHFD